MGRKMIKKGDIFAINYASLHYWDKGKQYIEPADGGDHTVTDMIALFNFKKDMDSDKVTLKAETREVSVNYELPQESRGGVI